MSRQWCQAGPQSHSEPGITSLTRVHRPRAGPTWPRFGGCPLPQDLGLRGKARPPACPALPQGSDPLPPHQVSSGKHGLGGGRQPPRAGDGSQGAAPAGGSPAHGGRGAMWGPAAAPPSARSAASPRPGDESGTEGRQQARPGPGPGPAGRGWRGAASRPEGGCGAAVEGGNRVGGICVSEGAGSGARAGGTDGGTDGRREPAERHRPSPLARRRCPLAPWSCARGPQPPRAGRCRSSSPWAPGSATPPRTCGTPGRAPAASEYRPPRRGLRSRCRRRGELRRAGAGGRAGRGGVWGLLHAGARP